MIYNHLLHPIMKLLACFHLVYLLHRRNNRSMMIPPWIKGVITDDWTFRLFGSTTRLFPKRKTHRGCYTPSYTRGSPPHRTQVNKRAKIGSFLCSVWGAIKPVPSQRQVGAVAPPAADHSFVDHAEREAIFWVVNERNEGH